MAIVPPPLFMVMRSVLLAIGAEAAMSRSEVGELIVMNTAAFAVRPTVSRVQVFSTSTPAGGWQAARGDSRTSANASRRTANLLLARNLCGLYAYRTCKGTRSSTGAGALV